MMIETTVLSAPPTPTEPIPRQRSIIALLRHPLFLLTCLTIFGGATRLTNLDRPTAWGKPFDLRDPSEYLGMTNAHNIAAPKRKPF